MHLSRYKMIFDNAPIAIMERDLNVLARLKQTFKRKKITKYRTYLRTHPRIFLETLRKLKIIHLNRAALNLYGAANKKEFIVNLNKTLHREAAVVLVEIFASILEGRRVLQGEFKSRTLDGKSFDVLMKVAVPKEHETNFRRAIFTFEDISVQKKYERHLKRLAQTDGLTRVLNHGAIRDRLEEEFLRAKRYNLDLSCMMIDMDKFKQINDAYGHQRGDTVLRETADLIRQNLREVDIVGRYGGDEFLVILPETSPKNAKIAAQRLKVIFERLTNEPSQGVYSTVSIGISGRSSKDINSVKDLIAQTDEAMYAAKKAGRNNIVIL
ncbi:MAG TPA: sensor domain-containing diguanylate cyclase [Candidatus Omnitrophota bacterium]|nr:sensor domain-containing diguanylate cyclase [Candidatus Omnitrophota bacterium]